LPRKNTEKHGKNIDTETAEAEAETRKQAEEFATDEHGKTRKKHRHGKRQKQEHRHGNSRRISHGRTRKQQRQGKE